MPSVALARLAECHRRLPGVRRRALYTVETEKAKWSSRPGQGHAAERSRRRASSPFRRFRRCARRGPRISTKFPSRNDDCAGVAAAGARPSPRDSPARRAVARRRLLRCLLVRARRNSAPRAAGCRPCPSCSCGAAGRSRTRAAPTGADSPASDAAPPLARPSDFREPRLARASAARARAPARGARAARRGDAATRRRRGRRARAVPPRWLSPATQAHRRARRRAGGRRALAAAPRSAAPRSTARRRRGDASEARGAAVARLRRALRRTRSKWWRCRRPARGDQGAVHSSRLRTLPAGLRALRARRTRAAARPERRRDRVASRARAALAGSPRALRRVRDIGPRAASRQCGRGDPVDTSALAHAPEESGDEPRWSPSRRLGEARHVYSRVRARRAPDGLLDGTLPTCATRSRLMPINRRFSRDEFGRACSPTTSRRRSACATVQYTLARGRRRRARLRRRPRRAPPRRLRPPRACASTRHLLDRLQLAVGAAALRDADRGERARRSAALRACSRSTASARDARRRQDGRGACSSARRARVEARRRRRPASAAARRRCAGRRSPCRGSLLRRGGRRRAARGVAAGARASSCAQTAGGYACQSADDCRATTRPTTC